MPHTRTVDTCRYRNIMSAMARAAAASDVFNAIGETHRREILDALVTGERPVGELVDVLRLTQPQVSKHLRVLSDVGLVRCRAEGRRRLYRLDHERLRPVHDWMEKYEQSWNRRLDRLDDYLSDLQRKERMQ
jgi:DNA-binding transcriptional ArsR family regulator